MTTILSSVHYEISGTYHVLRGGHVPLPMQSDGNTFRKEFGSIRNILGAFWGEDGLL